MNEPNYWRRLSAADRLRLVAFEGILLQMPTWMVAAIWEAAENADNRLTALDRARGKGLEA